MERNHYDIAQDKAGFLSDKLAGMAYLFQNAKIESMGSRDSEAHYGIGVILEGFAEEARNLDRMLDSTERPTYINAKKTLEKLARETV